MREAVRSGKTIRAPFARVIMIAPDSISRTSSGGIWYFFLLVASATSIGSEFIAKGLRRNFRTGVGHSLGDGRNIFLFPGRRSKLPLFYDFG